MLITNLKWTNEKRTDERPIITLSKTPEEKNIIVQTLSRRNEYFPTWLGWSANTCHWLEMIRVYKVTSI